MSYRAKRVYLMKEFDKFAVKGRGISSMTLSRYSSVYDGYINPTITEERKLNVAQMDVFSRLMMDRDRKSVV